ncbi:MAG: S8 family serine peptidase [Thermoflavifilum sp.]|nr:S8 family serine peptidase [Thermoflavifilum sp.]MCL6514744.1 S8 family serine peptidase [Alicyclobacillus sp.]
MAISPFTVGAGQVSVHTTSIYAAASAKSDVIAAPASAVGTQEAVHSAVQMAMGSTPATTVSRVNGGSSQHVAKTQMSVIRTKKLMHESTPYLTDRVLVKFKSGQAVTSVNVGGRSIALHAARTFSMTGVQMISVPKGVSVSQLIDALKSSGAVVYAQPDYKMYPLDDGTDPLFSQEWGLHNTGQDIVGQKGTSGVDIDVLTAWHALSGTATQPMVVAVIDTGVDVDHPDIQPHLWTDLEGDHGYDFVNNTPITDSTQADPFADLHGTHVAGIIGGTLNGTGVQGVAQNVQLMICKVVGSNGYTTDDKVIEAIEYASAHGARIANLSLGTPMYDAALREAMARSNMLFVAAAGNDGENLDVPGSQGTYPADYDLPNEISVAAVDNQGNLAWFSNYGWQHVQLAAPGVDVLSSAPKHTYASPASVLISGTASNYKALVQGFGLEELDSENSSKDVLSRGLQELGVYPGHKILLVDDDGHDSGLPDVSTYYTNALEAAGYSYDVWRVGAQDDNPTASMMENYDAVLWVTGEATGTWTNNGTWLPNLTSADIQQLESYLQAGGRLYLSGATPLAGDEPLENDSFASRWLHLSAVVEDEETRTDLTGSGSVYEGSSYALAIYPYVGSNTDFIPSNDGHTAVDIYWPADTDYSQAYAYRSGTSMAAPFVTGVAALVWGEHPDWTVQQVRAALVDTAKPLHDVSNEVFGGGMVDAAKALQFNPSWDIPGTPLWTKDATTSRSVTASLTSTAHPGTIGDDNVWSVPLHQGEILRATLTVPSHADFDLYLYGPETSSVLTSEGLLAASTQDTGKQEAITFVAPTDGTYYLDVEALSGSGQYTLKASTSEGVGPGVYDDGSPYLVRQGTWTRESLEGTLGGTALVASGTGHSVTVYFTGTSVGFDAVKGPDQGVALVSIDGGRPTSVSLFSQKYTVSAPVYIVNGLAPGLHRITIESTGTSVTGLKAGSFINVDAITVSNDAQAPSAPTQFKAALDASKHPVLRWSDNWEPGVVTYMVQRADGLGGSFHTIAMLTRTSGHVVWTYTDTRVAVIQLHYQYRVVAVNASGRLSSPSSTLTLTPSSVTVDDTSKALQYTGYWLHVKGRSDGNGTISQTASRGASVTWTFTGTDVTLYAMTGPNEGYADLYLDGKKVATLNFYAYTTHFKAPVFSMTGLSEKSHTLKLVAEGKHSQGARGSTITLDSIVYTP